MKIREGDGPTALSTLTQRLPAIHPYLVQLKKLVDGFRVALSGEIQQPSALVEFLFFGMRSRASLHSSTFLHPLQGWSLAKKDDNGA